MEDFLAVGATAMLALAPCPDKADMIRQLRPVDRVEVQMLGADGHQASDTGSVNRDEPVLSEVAVSAVSAR
jgi:hypothetical protein